MSMEKQAIQVYLKRLAFFLFFILLVIFLMDLNSRLAELFRKDMQREEAREEVIELELTKQFLYTQIAYATSEAAVEEWARESSHMALEGDNPVVPLAVPGTTPSPVVHLLPTPTPIEKWDVWQELLFGE